MSSRLSNQDFTEHNWCPASDLFCLRTQWAVRWAGDNRQNACPRDNRNKILQLIGISDKRNAQKLLKDKGKGHPKTDHKHPEGE